MLVELLGVCMVWIRLQRLLQVLEGLLTLSKFVRNQGAIKERLVEERRKLERGLEVRARDGCPTFAEFEDTQIVECFCMIPVNRESNFESLVGNIGVPNADGQVPDVKPNVRHVVIVSKSQRTLETAQRHVILRKESKKYKRK